MLEFLGDVFDVCLAILVGLFALSIFMDIFGFDNLKSDLYAVFRRLLRLP